MSIRLPALRAFRAAFLPLAASILTGVIPAQLVGVTFSGDVVRIEDFDGSTTVLGPSGFTPLTSLSRSPSGSFVAASRAAVTPPKLVTIDPAGGPATFLEFPFLNEIGSLAHSPTGVLYASNVLGSVQSDLYWFDFSKAGTSEIKVLVGSIKVREIGFSPVIGMDFAPDGTLYGWSLVHGLVTIDTTTAECTDVNGLIDGSSIIQSIAFSPTGKLYGAYDSIYTIDVATGAVSLVGAPGALGIRGIEYDVEALPDLYATPSLASGSTVSVELDALPAEIYVLAVAPTAGPLCLPGLPFCLDLGPTLANVIIAGVGLVPPSGEKLLQFPTTPDPGLSGVVLHWQAVTIDGAGAYSKSDPQATAFL